MFDYISFHAENWYFFQLHKNIFGVTQIDLEMHILCRLARYKTPDIDSIVCVYHWLCYGLPILPAHIYCSLKNLIV